MHSLPLQDPLEGCVLSWPTRWPGLYKLEACPGEKLDKLARIPGVRSFENKRNMIETGWYVPESLRRMGAMPANLMDYDPEEYDTTPSGLKLRRYQARTVTFLRQTNSMREGVVLWADPGLGKTVSSLHANWLDGYLQRPGLIVGPNIAKGVWCDDDSDALVHYNLKVLPLEGMKNIDPGILEHHTCFFCHYEIIQAWQAWIFATLKPAWMILDESHFLIHQKALRSKASRQLALLATIERRFCLTGTAIPNERLDLWNQLATAQPRQWGNTHHDFGVRYCAGQRMAPEEGGHWTYDGETNTEELRARLAGTLLRYTTEEVGDELPPMERHVIEAEGIEEHLLDDYSLAQRDVIGYLRLKGAIPDETIQITLGNTVIKLGKNDHKPGAARLVCLTTLIGILSEMKQAPALKAIISILGAHNRVVVFTWRRKTAEWIYDKLANLRAQGIRLGGKTPLIFGPVHGDMDMADRKALAKEFAKAPCSIYVATMGAAGTSINTLSAASAALIVDLHWNTSQLRQAEKRVHRDGCTADKVDIYYLVVRRTADDIYIEKLNEKARKAAAISPDDKSDLNLVRDLTPDRASEEYDFELLCARLMDLDEEWEREAFA